MSFTAVRSARRGSPTGPASTSFTVRGGSTAANARPVAVPSTDITEPARMFTCSGWLPSITRTMVGPKFAHTAIATVWSIACDSASATGPAALIGSSWCRQARPSCSAAGPSA